MDLTRPRHAHEPAGRTDGETPASEAWEAQNRRVSGLLGRGHFFRAEVALSKALRLAAKIPDAGFRTARTLKRMAMLRTYREDWVSGRRSFQRALPLFEALMEPGHPHVTSTLYLLRMACLETRDLDAASHVAARLEEALADTREPGGALLATEVGRGLPNARGRAPEVEVFFWPSRRLLESGRRTAGPASDLGLLAQYHHSRGWYEFAETLYGEAIRWDGHQSGPNDPRLVTDLENLAELLDTLGRGGEAATCRVRAERVRSMEAL